ncbi:hypothetical protein, partial [Ralstonia pseudosolanacearum]|uniref:hypothetical protein n=1 Tax=Ralstonia pseudosolanacearum TaxID=1310165 RepID=UPI001E420A3A
MIDPLTAFPFDNNSLQKPTLDHLVIHKFTKPCRYWGSWRFETAVGVVNESESAFTLAICGE